MSAHKQEDQLIRYLLGTLSQQEREQIETQYVEDEDFFTELQVAEDEIIDAYVKERLAARDRELFEKNFLISQHRRERVRSARALLAFARKRKELETHAWISPWQRARAFLSLDYRILQSGLVAGLALAIVTGGWLLVEVARLRSQLDDAQVAQLQREQEINRKVNDLARINEELKQASSAEKEKLEHEREQQIPVNRILVSAVFKVEQSEISRGGTLPKDQKTISIPASAKTVRLQLDLKQDDYRWYVAVLLTARGKEIRRDSLTSTKTTNGRSVILRISAKDLAAGNYRLLLEGVTEKNEIEEVGKFSIRIIRK